MDEEFQSDMLGLVRERFRTEKRELMDLLSLKEREVAELRSQIETLTSELELAKRDFHEERGLRLQELAQFEQEMLSLKKKFNEETAGFAEQLRLKDAAFEKLGQGVISAKNETNRLHEENKKLLRDWAGQVKLKEEEIESLRIKESALKEQIVQSQDQWRHEKEGLAAQVNGLEKNLNQLKLEKDDLITQLKTAIGKSTASLLEEKAGARLQEQRLEDLGKRVAELEAERAKILNDWAKERAKWEQLWERERRVWENQRGVFAEEQDRFLKEKEQWEAHLRDKEEKEMRLTKLFNTMFSELNRWVAYFKTGNEPLVRPQIPPSFQPGAGQVIAGSEAPPSSVIASPETQGGKLRKGKVLIFLAVALIAGAAWFFGRRFFAEPILLIQKNSWPLPINTPAGIASDNQGLDLWLADWESGALIKVERANPSEAAQRFEPRSPLYHPNAMALSPDGKYLFTLDSVAHKIYKHKTSGPSDTLQETDAPTASSLFLAVLEEGPNYNLVVLDSFERKLYLYDPASLGAKPKEGGVLPQEISPLGLCGFGSWLYALDGKANRMTALTQRGGAWKIAASFNARFNEERALNTVSGFYAFGDKKSRKPFKDIAFYALFESQPGKLVLLQNGDVVK